jgi:exosome complex component RRP42
MVILMSDILNLINAGSIKEKIKNGKREDNRGFEDFRDLEIKTSVLSSADGSAWVKLGNTEVVAGIKFAVGTPYPDSPDEGSMSLNLELTGISSPDFSTGPPQIDSLEYGRVADRAIRSAEAIDFKKLSIVAGEKVFIIFIDCIAINADGNLIDATEIAALAALKNAKIPKLDENNNIISKEYTDQKLELLNIPLSFTFEKIEGKIIVDPTEAEEFASDARFSLGLVKDTVVSCQKSKNGVFTEEEIFKMIDLSVNKYTEIVKKIEALE